MLSVHEAPQATYSPLLGGSWGKSWTHWPGARCGGWNHAPGTGGVRAQRGWSHPALHPTSPGYYAAGRFGIRHENLLLVQPAEAAGFLRFETLTLAPFDRTPWTRRC